MLDLSRKIGTTTVQRVLIGKKLEQDLKLKEIKHPIVNQQWLVHFHVICVMPATTSVKT